MNGKEKIKAMKCHLFYCLMQLLLECLDDLQVTNPKMIILKNNLIEFCELLNEECKDTYTIQKTTYFQNITNKINTILRHNFNSEM
jgi:hypothetical protein